MILVDMNQISLASMMMHLHMSKSKEIDEKMVRHMILNSLRMYRTRFSSEMVAQRVPMISSASAPYTSRNLYGRLFLSSSFISLRQRKIASQSCADYSLLLRLANLYSGK